jgi:tRNA-dihydrouridine synthase B
MFRIGHHQINPPFLLAPMASVSEMPYRVLALEFGAGLATTELISAKGIFYQNQRTKRYLTYDKEREVPFSLQLFGGDESSMCYAAVEAAKIGADIIDINMGCPVKKVTKTGAGSAFLCDPKRAAGLVSAMRSAVGESIPITVKIRSGWDDKSINCVEMAKELEAAGCAALALHARTRAQGYSGQANWDLIRQVKESVSMPIIGNGDVTSLESAREMMKQTGCDAVMIGRAALGNPWIFSDIEPTALQRLEIARRHFNEHVAFNRAHLADTDDDLPAIRSFRPHFVWYSKGLHGASHFREKIMQAESLSEIEDLLENFFARSENQNRDQSPSEDDGIDYRQAFG